MTVMKFIFTLRICNRLLVCVSSPTVFNLGEVPSAETLKVAGFPLFRPYRLPPVTLPIPLSVNNKSSQALHVHYSFL
jgi:hypothetical protein